MSEPVLDVLAERAMAGDMGAVRSLRKWSAVSRQTREHWRNLRKHNRELAFMASEVGSAHIRAVRRATEHAQECFEHAMARTWGDPREQESISRMCMPVNWMESYSESMGFPHEGVTLDEEYARARTVAKIAAEFGGNPAHPQTEEEFYADLIKNALQRRDYGDYSNEHVNIPVEEEY
jgi:hypothetical protein